MKAWCDMETCAMHRTQEILESVSLRVSQCLQQAENSKVLSWAHVCHLIHSFVWSHWGLYSSWGFGFILGFEYSKQNFSNIGEKNNHGIIFEFSNSFTCVCLLFFFFFKNTWHYMIYCNNAAAVYEFNYVLRKLLEYFI